MRWAALFALLAGVLALRLHIRRYRRCIVDGTSMAPAIRPNDWLIVDARAYRERPLTQGHVVLAFDPRMPERKIIKRVESVRPGGAWLLGDNIEESTDSRTFGVVAHDEILGRVRLRYWPKPRLF